MRIAYIAAGAADMYCGSCLHDNTLAAGLQKMGHDAVLVPTYTPLRTDAPGVSLDRVFFGALNVYLQQKAAAFRHTPPILGRSFDWLLDRPGLIRRAARLGASTDPTELGDLTYSILQGEEGFQAKELAKLVEWLHDDFRPDVVHLTNSMFAGFARQLKRELGVPVVCSLQGEDLFLDQIREPWRTRVRELLRERARDVDAFQVHSAWYADFMADYLGGIDRGRMLVVPLGLNLNGHAAAPLRVPDDPLTIGYLARICPEKGLHQLVEAFHLLASQMPGVRLRVAGYLGVRDRAYLHDLEARIADWGLAGSYEHVGEVDHEEKIRFLQSLDVLSVPTVYREPKGLFVLEALASGVPVVQPRHGAFPEMIEATGGGLLVEPGSAEDLARGIGSLLRDPALRRELGERGREAVHTRFNVRAEADATVQGYERLLSDLARRATA
ncbi:MAG TPA: glycosyltransferase family 4 protein [Thermoanaerobaculia bacterium]|nr:glycosyltransferase family 4 protein [Thermoanaerobaculia bacterium]